jgi:hypothetical protein
MSTNSSNTFIFLFLDHCEAKGNEKLPVELSAQLLADQSECLTALTE